MQNKFENEPSWVALLWDLAMAGKADESVFDGTNVIYGFQLNAKYAELTGYNADGNRYVVLWQGTGGNVSSDILTHRELLECEGFDVFEEIPTKDYFPDSTEGDLGGESDAW